MPGNPNLLPVKKRKKRAPDRQQPEWLFPADSENPALKPHKEPTVDDKLAKERSIDFLKRRAAGAPTSRPAPPVQLLNLVGAFLAEYNFTSTGRLFSAERQGRSKLDGWKDETGGKLDKGMPTLSKIYKEWRKEWDERRLLDMTSSDEEDDAASKREKMLKKKERVENQKQITTNDATSSSGGEDSSSENSDVEMEDAPISKKIVTKKTTSSSSSSSTSSDSDADDEKELPVQRPAVTKPKANSLKRKSSATSSSSSASDSNSSSSDEAPKAKKIKTISNSSKLSDTNKPVADTNVKDSKDVKPEIGNSSDSTSDSDADSDSASSTTSLAKKTPLPASSDSNSSSESDSDASPIDDKRHTINSDTSATLSDVAKKISPNASSDTETSSDSEADVKPQAAVPAKAQRLSPPLPPTPVAKLPRRTNSPFSRIPKDTKVDKRLASNAYVPYDYAQKAHQDLIVTKGKGFTKEKNKKKRGSYKGGYIDVEGKKGIKFDD